MTEREHRLRMRIDTLLAERDQALDLVTVLKASVSTETRPTDVSCLPLLRSPLLRTRLPPPPGFGADRGDIG